MKKWIAMLLVLVMALTMAACGCEHEFAAATCTAPSTCTLCGETEGEALGHVWMAATCEDPKTCEVCAATDGEAKGHTMVEATCEEAKHCEVCDLVEGEALGHTWVDATTEAPQTCEVCAATEGERIITDERFTTAATSHLQGKWMMEVPMDGEMMGIPGFPETTMNFVMNLSNDGHIDFTVEVTDAFMESMRLYTIESVYVEFEALDISREDADVMFAESYGMSIEEYVDAELAGLDMNELYSSLFAAMNFGGVYYVEGDQIFSAGDWEDEMIGDVYVLEGDSLTIETLYQDLGIEGVFTRVVEE
ncbi:MAG: hypothetical protein IIW56_08625 [Oscillospiraceae bacterium]|nr:hypothetical protein [Oscillospiraceae bacterium]